MDKLSQFGEPIEKSQELIASATKRSAEYFDDGAPVDTELITKLVRRVVVYSDRIVVETGKRELGAEDAMAIRFYSDQPKTFAQRPFAGKACEDEGE